MNILKYFNQSPFRELIGIEITEAKDGYAEGHLLLQDHHSSNQKELIAQGGVTFTLADSVGGAAAISLEQQLTPTIDFRIDYLNPATANLYATGEVVRHGTETSVVDIDIQDEKGQDIATGRGVYKTSKLSDTTPWDLTQSE